MIATDNISEFGVFNGQKVYCISLTNKRGTVLKLLTWGATWHALELEDIKGIRRDIVVSPKTFEGYLFQEKTQPYYFGNSIGRCAGRLSDKRKVWYNQKFELEFQDGFHLHGGKSNMRNKIWEIISLNTTVENPSVTLGYHSPHLEEGYPGEVLIKACYKLKDNNKVQISYTATSNTDTILNLTNHAYFNLGENSVESHLCQIASGKILETDDKLIPTGRFVATKGTPFDFQNPKKLSQIREVRGLDTCFVLEKERPQIKLHSKISGIELQVETNQPSAVIFAPKNISFAAEPKSDYWGTSEYPAICFETQNYPDAPNQPNFPSSLLKMGETYQNKTSFKFNLKEE